MIHIKQLKPDSKQIVSIFSKVDINDITSPAKRSLVLHLEDVSFKDFIE